MGGGCAQTSGLHIPEEDANGRFLAGLAAELWKIVIANILP